MLEIGNEYIWLSLKKDFSTFEREKEREKTTIFQSKREKPSEYDFI